MHRGYPPFEGPITSSAETGPFNVTIPFFGAKGTDRPAILANDNGATTAASLTVPNPNFTGFGPFSSGGPRNGDSFLKPDITAPGVSIQSTFSGGGTLGTVLSGTSMASPHVAGVAALMRQAHPAWSVDDVKAAIVNTASPAGVAGYRTSRGGAGFVQPVLATATTVVAHTDAGSLAVALNFGFAELDRDYSTERKLTLNNTGNRAVTFRLSQSLPSGRVHSVSFDPQTITVPGTGQCGDFGQARGAARVHRRFHCFPRGVRTRAFHTGDVFGQR
jgi:subtilisin family serine protease